MKGSGLSLVVAAVWLTLVGAVVTNYVTDDNPPWWLWLVWVAIGVALTAVEVLRNRGGLPPLLGGPGEPSPRDRIRVLDQSHAAVRTALDEAFTGITRLDLAIRVDDKLVHELLPAFERDESLLVLGAAGSGKSTELARLAEALADKASKNDHEPIPIILNLAGWGRRRSRLADMLRRAKTDDEPEALLDWLLAQAHARYKLVPDVARAWLRRRQLVLLLDGLDEVPAPLRVRCANQIAALATDDAAPPLVVTCRTVDHEDLTTRLRRTATIEPLTPDQVAQHVRDLPEGLREIVDAPLWLRVLLTVHDRVDLTDGDLRRRLLDAYLAELLDRRRIDRVTTLRRLSTLVRIARTRNDPDVATPHLPRWSDVAFAGHLPPEAVSLARRLIVPPALATAVTSTLVAPVALRFGVVPAAWSLLAGVALVAIPAGMLNDLTGRYVLDPLSRRPLRRLAGVLVGVMLGSALGGVCFTAVYGLSVAPVPVRTWTLALSAVAMVYMLTNEMTKGKSFLRILAVVGVYTAWRRFELHDPSLALGFAGGTLGVAACTAMGMLGFFSSQGQADSMRTIGTRAAFWRPVVVTAVVGGLMAGAGAFTEPVDQGSRLYAGLAVGVVLGGVPAAYIGLALGFVIERFGYRPMLAWTGLVPWRVRRFLRTAAAAELVRSSGEEFHFPHLVLRNHLGAIDPFDGRPPTTESTAAQRQAVLTKVRMQVSAKLLPEPPPRHLYGPTGRGLELPGGGRVVKKWTATTLGDAFYQTDRAMLLVGAAESDLPELLAELTQSLLDSTDLIPMTVNLATYPNGPRATNVVRPFTGWLLDQLEAQYGVEPELGLRWLTEHRLALLIHGYGRRRGPAAADEAAVIEEFLAAYGIPPVVLAGRDTGVPPPAGLHRAELR
ncbi:NACHT domain-containing protein [Saccharothrix carnea]|uniref:NACHT domain-containing protein n=2 Tax=Saccharothrix carnea TaxID=1280637 RepID=A0A2P8HZ65_SACCR|nr:NACHT domain-containing protein [Saccharothrix carnea]